MEVHPHPAPHSFKELLVQLFTITLGVLIALGLEGLVEWQHHRSLVREARRMIALEIDDNRRELSGELGAVEQRRQDLGQAFRLADELLTVRKSDVQQFTLGVTLSSLGAASWHTAERTGALGYMEYEEVKRYSEIYALQELFAAQQRRVMQSLSGALPISALGDPHKAQVKDLEAFRTHVLETLGELAAEEQLGRQLLKGYETAAAR
jgi:hypothetical protein